MAEKITQTAGREQLGDFAPNAEIIAGEILNGNPGSDKLSAFADKY